MIEAIPSGPVDSLWRPIEFLVPEETLVLASCPPCADFPQGRVMIWKASILFHQNDRTPRHLRFPATRWCRLDDVVLAVTAYMPMREALKGLKLDCRFDVLNPCWDGRPEDVPGKHWGGGDACASCVARAAIATAEGRS